MTRKDLDMVNNPWKYCAMDAVFLPGKIHGCEDEVYILYFNECADDGSGCWEIEIVDRGRIIEIYDKVGGNEEKFFEVLPDYFHGEWLYCNRKGEHEEYFIAYAKAFPEADYISGIDEGSELEFLMKWAKGE